MEDRLDARGMIKGVFDCKEFILVMTHDYFDRKYCVFEFLIAMAFKKPITMLLEIDTRFGGTTIEKMSKELPRLYCDILVKHEIVEINRVLFDAFVDRVGKRLQRPRKILKDG